MVLAASSLCSAMCCVVCLASMLTIDDSRAFLPMPGQFFVYPLVLAIGGAVVGGFAISRGDKRLALASIGCFLAAVAVSAASYVLNKRQYINDIKLLLMSGLCASIAMFATFFAVFKN
jgi:hypothetical protein